MKILNLFLSFSLFTILIISGCDDTLTEDTLPQIPPSNVSFAQHLQPVFNLKCVPCHNEVQRDGGLSMETWSSTTADPRIVFPGNPDNSVLVWSIEAKPGVSPMPPLGSSYPPLTQEQVVGVIKWIEEGAKNN